MEQIYTIPVNEAFELCGEDKFCGCPFCLLYNRLEENELDLILGASMMEPDVRIKTNEEGFCKTHYDMMFVRKNRLGMALTLESHLDELYNDITAKSILPPKIPKSVERIKKLEDECYVCRRIEFNFSHMIETAVLLWSNDEAFSGKLNEIPYFCLPHYRRVLEYAQKRLSKKDFSEFKEICEKIVNTYFEELKEDISWFCKKFDYRYDKEPWYNSKDSVERAIKFLRGDLHKEPPTNKKS